MAASYGEEGRASYRTFELTGDIIYTIVYTLFFAFFITWLFQRGFPSGSKMQKLNVVPFGGWLFDLFENLGIVAMLSVYPSMPAALPWISAIFTVVKWLFAGATRDGGTFHPSVLHFPPPNSRAFRQDDHSPLAHPIGHLLAEEESSQINCFVQRLELIIGADPFVLEPIIVQPLIR